MRNSSVPAPTTALWSGGPGSLASWASLGHQGRIFLHGGPTVAQLSEFNKAPATEPIRAYAGLNSAKGIRATAELAAAELVRQGGLKRKLIAHDMRHADGLIRSYRFLFFEVRGRRRVRMRDGGECLESANPLDSVASN